MQINDDLQPVHTSPGDGLGEVRELALNIGLAPRHIESPVPNGKANMIEPVRFVKAGEGSEGGGWTNPAAAI